MMGRRVALFIAAGALLMTGLWSSRRIDGPPTPVASVRETTPATPVVVPAASSAPATTSLPFSSMHGRLVDPEGQSATAFLDRMAPLARRGDADIAYRVYQVEAMCGAVDPERRLIRAATAVDADTLANWKRWVDRMAEACTGVTPAQIEERFGFLEQAIRAGNHEAMLDYRSEGPLGFDFRSLDPDDSRLVDWKRRSNDYLEWLAAQGERDAWARLTGDYRGGWTVPQNYGAAIKYRMALIASGSQPDIDPMSLGDIEEMSRSMSPSDVRSAI